MALQLTNLDERTRQLMVEEIQRDIDAGSLYVSTRLNQSGKQGWSNLLKDAATGGNDGTLASTLRSGSYFNPTYERRNPSGTTSYPQMPVNAPDTLAEGEFNRFYIRAVCRRAIEDGLSEVVVYRAGQVAHPRPESQAKIGARVNAQALLNDLRTHQGIDTALGLPAGPNSGLSVRLP